MIKKNRDFEIDFDEDLIFEDDDMYEGVDYGFLDRKKTRNVFVAS